MVSIAGWEAMLARAQVRGLSPYATLGAARLCFLSSARCVVDEERTNRHTRANFSEWVEALARFANILQEGVQPEAAQAPLEYREERSSEPMSFTAEAGPGGASDAGSGASDSSSGDDEGEGEDAALWGGEAAGLATPPAWGRDAWGPVGTPRVEWPAGEGSHQQHEAGAPGHHRWQWQEPEGPLPGEPPTASARFAQLMDMAFAGLAAAIVESMQSGS